MKMKTGKKLALFFLSACIVLSLVFGAMVLAGASAVPTSESISGLTAVYSYVENEDTMGTIAVNAQAQNIDPEEYVMFYVFQNVDDISDPTNGRQNAPVVMKTFAASTVVTDAGLAKDLPLTAQKLNGKCVVWLQVADREENDWVAAYITTAIKLNANGGTLIGDDELQARLGFGVLAELGEAARAVREYYSLVGWSATADGEVIGADALVTPYGGEFFAVWEQLKTTVTFNSNGGSGEMQSVVINAGEETELPASEFRNPGKRFVGWGTSPEGPAVFTDGEKVTLDGTVSELPLYAIWEDIDVYVVSFEPNGGDGEMRSLEVEDGDTVALTENAFIRRGYKFLGWATSADGAVVYTDKQEVTISGADLRLYAVWKQNNIAVIYSPNGGTGLMTPHKMSSGETITLDPVTYTCKGKAFIGWSTSVGGPVEYEDGAEFTIGEKSVVLYAIWKSDARAILFSTGGGTGYMAPLKGLGTGDVITLPACAYTKSGYSFAGWSTSAGGSVSYYDGDTITVGETNQVLYAVWMKVA